MGAFGVLYLFDPKIVKQQLWLQFKKHNSTYTYRKAEPHLYRKLFLSFWKLTQTGLTPHVLILSSAETDTF